MRIIKRVGAFFGALVLSASSLSLLTLSIVNALPPNCTWTGVTNTNFSTATNWSGCGGVPANGDNLIFNNTTLGSVVTLNDDLSGLSVANISFTGTSSFASFKIGGNAITTTNGISDSTISSISPQFINAVVISGNQTVTTTDTAGLTFSVLQGTGHLNITGGKVAEFQDLTGYTGNISSADSIVDLAPSGTSIMTSSGSVTITGSGTLQLLNAGGGKSSSDITFNLPISLGNTDIKPVALNLATGVGGAVDILSGPVTLTSNISVTADGNYSLNITGPVNFNGYSLDSENPGVVAVNVAPGSNLSGENPIIGNHVTYTVDGTVGSTTVNSGGLLKGLGTIGNTTVNSGGVIAPGHSPGCLTISGNFNLAGTYTADIQSPGNTTCTDYNQLVVSGNVTLTGGTLNTLFLSGFNPAVGQSYEIINNKGLTAVNGTFNGLPEGAVFSAGSVKLKITYKGGTGNDVVLTVVTASTPNTGFGTSNNYIYILIAGVLTLSVAGVFYIKSRNSKITN